MSGVRVGDLESAVMEAFPREWAESWDAIGLRVGDSAAQVAGVLVTLDATVATIDRAKASGANVLVTHHPPALGEHSVFTAGGSSAALFHAASSGIAVISAHTNLDRSPEGAPVLLRAMGLGDGEPLESGVMESILVTVYVPAAQADSVRAAMASAGAGRIGDYRACSFEAEGRGRFTPPVGSEPFSGRSEEPSEADEHRLEMVASAQCRDAVLAAARDSHPYEEPLITLTPIAISRSAARLGRAADLGETSSLADLAGKVAAVFDCTPTVWGQPDVIVRRLATATGSGGSLIGAAISSGSDALLLGEVRYHDALDALGRGLSLIEAGHDVTEWPLVPVLAAAVRDTPGLASELVETDGPSRAWWTP